MSAIRNWLRGRDLSYAQIEPCTVDATGVLTVVTASGKSLIGRCQGVTIRPRNVTDMIMSVDDTVGNNVSLYDDYTIEISEILTRKTATVAGGYEPILPSLYFNYEYFKVTIVKGGKQYIIYGLRSDMTDGHVGQAQQSASMTLVSVNVNVDSTSTASIAYGNPA